MKKNLFLLFLLAFVITACNLPAVELPTPTQPIVPTQPAPTDDIPQDTPSPDPTEQPTMETPPAEEVIPVDTGGAIIIDHTSIDISQIPPEWLEKAKTLAVAYGHTSHGSQIITGLLWLEQQDPAYSVAVQSTWDGLGLPDEQGVLRIYDGNNVEGDDYITPELYWSTDEGIQYTRSVAESGLFDYAMWSWCGQQSENDAATVNTYLDTLNQLEQDYPDMRWIYMTGHTDGNWDGSRLQENNQMVRDYVLANGKILYDFEDIESYDPDGVYHAPTEADFEAGCSWCQSYCDNHPAYCANLDQIEDCAHTHPLYCKMKANAFWWMMARLAGWQP